MVLQILFVTLVTNIPFTIMSDTDYSVLFTPLAVNNTVSIVCCSVKFFRISCEILDTSIHGLKQPNGPNEHGFWNY